MQVKVFEAQDMASGLKKVKEALGPDALILSTRTVRRGKMGMLGKPILEITAAIDKPWPASETGLPDPERQSLLGQAVVGPEDNELTYEALWKKTESTSSAPGNEAASTADRPDPAIREELSELRNLIHGLSERLAGINNQNVARPYVEPEYLQPPGDQSVADHPIMNRLARLGINSEAASTIAQFTRQNFGDKLPDTATLDDFLTTTITGLFRTSQPLSTKDPGQKRIALIGPTGVGKTTTIAKIAANYLSRHSASIALITIDTYRIAAVEQLKVYGEIMKLPVEVVIRPEDMDRALERHRDKELILIDTAGRSPRNNLDIEEMTGFLRPHLEIENHLVLSATTREEELDEIILRFGCLAIDNLIFTKIDECALLGVLLNMHIKKGTPISFLTNGQRVPEDIITPDPQTIAGLIMDTNRTLHHG
ncbi:flagellar biosynthesis protein FlhF [Desulfolithobacter dissulfuricans]|uniref:Flagellar biosynthesis protein FlhF n=1 Tax=Desulfolithobacter dissulfuricans TaxID=2795293 RepID=A0A915U910_9BACT|nr:flagellar biosynthesis protein FlhF [Desulfolithobacter dissulfuricans]BCO08526.1 flagellar biosynthesis protein FlhF [Desulfolithobacter dissulfuricans]